MASLIDKIADIFKPKKDTISVETTQGNKKTGTVDFSTSAPAKTTQVSTPKTTPAAQAFKPAQVQTTQAAGFYMPTGSLAQRAYKRDLAIGNVSATAPEKNNSFFSAYYKVLDDPKYSRMYTDLEKLKAGSNAKNGKDFKSQYDSGLDNLDAEIKAAKKQYGKNSDEYRALQQFKEDYTKLGSQIQANYSYKDSQKLSRQLDNTIDTVFAGYTNTPGYQQKVEKGKEIIEKVPDVAKRFNHDMKGASDKQMNLLYAVAADEGIAGARDFYDRFLNPTVSRIGALRDFSSGISSNGKVQKVFSAASGAAAGAVANSAIIGDGVQKGIDVLTGKAKALDDDVLAGDFTVQDSVDDLLRSEFAGINQADLDQYGNAAFDQMSTALPGSDWLQDADEDATDYQKQLLGYVYLASDGNEEAAKGLWETIKARDSEIRQTVNGSTYGSTSQNAVKSQLYQEYLDKNKLMLGLYKSVVTTGSQLDRTLLSFIPVIGTALSLGVMGLDVYGKTYSEDILNGRAEDGKTAGHAATAALLEVAMEKLLGGLNHIPGLAIDEVSKRFVKNLANPWARGAVNTLLRLHGEGTEEALTDVANAISTGLWFGEGNIAQRVKQGFEDDFDAQQMLESYIYGAISAFFLGGMSTAGEIHADFNYRELGQHLNTLESTDKLIDTILNTKIDEKAGKLSKKLYGEAKELAQGMKDGKLKKNDANVGEMFANFAKSGGDVQWLTNPDTVNYNKDTLTEENFIAGATSRLAELGADTSLAGDIARWAMGQAPSQEAFNKIKSDPRATQVLQELIDPLDMEQDNALTRAVQSTTRNVTGNKTYDTLVASNPNQTVVNPATQQLINLGVELEEAQGIGDVIAKVMAGETITEDEAELVSVSNAAVRSVLSSVANVELAEDATIGAVMDALNGVAADAAKVKEQQAAVAEGAEAAARARMPIPPNTSGTVSMAGVEMTHDQFIERFMQKPGATLEQAEKAWENNRTVSAALNGEEENNGTTPGNQEGRNPDLAGRSPIPAATQRTAGSGRPVDTGGTEQSGGVAEDRQSADLRRGYTEDQVIKAFNSKQRAFMRSCLDAGFKTTKLIKGPILRQGVDKDGNPVTYEVNALVDDDGNLVIRWDNPYASPLRVALHERIHLWLSAKSDSERAAFVKQALQDIFGDNTAAFDAMYKAYADVYAKAYTGLTGEAFADHVMEEMLADMYAGMNNYGANAGSYQSQAEMYVQQAGLREKFFGEEGGFSFDEQFSLNDPFRGDVDRSKPPETRPFPGEKAMHDNMELLSLTSMAQGANFELRLNSQGQPYELIDKKTGKRVEHVTGEMMIDTPLGNIVQLAVDNGNIDADEAAQQRDMLASAMNLIVDYDDAALVWELVGSQMFSAVKANSDKQYNKTIDFSTICKKTMAIVDAMSETMKKLGRGLTRREVEIVYEEVGKKGLATPCPVCYVFSRWMGIGGLLDQMNRFQVKYGDMSEEEIVAFMTRIENEAYAYAKKNPKSTYWDKNGNFLIGKVISDMKSGPNSKAAAAIETLNAHQQALATIAELEKAKEKATPAMAKKYGEMIRQLRYNVKSEKALAEAEAKMQAAEADIEPYEEYQWLAKTMMISDSSQVNDDGESVGSWKRNPNFKPVPQDILFDLNKGAEFAKDYPLSWAFRTGKGCAAGKAIAPYSDARVGETIQGVATDVKNIRVELDESQHDSFVQDYMRKNNATREVAEEAWQNRPHNEFLTGDTKAQQKTLKTARKKQRQQNLIGGMRYQSTSDFRYEFGSDYLMTFLEMQALGANVQLYTKVIEAVDFLASTGADCNLSVMPLGDGYEEYVDPETGETKQRLIFSDITGINADAAIKKSQEYDNVQLILVGINDTNIRLALEGDEVTFVIPFHGSGQSVHQIQGLMDLIGEHLDVTKAQDYTSVQSDRAIKDRAEKHPELQAMWDLRMDIIMGKFLTEEQKETLKAWENATSQEEKTALANRLAELGKAQEGLSAEQKARLAQNKHLQKLYNMFYVDTTDPAFYNNLAKDQAEHIFPYEYWIKDGDYAHADENGRVFQEYCASIGVIPRFSGINSKYQKTGFGDFTQDKGYWKLLIDRSMYENVYDEKGNWIGYGKYRPQQQINMTNIDIGDLSRKAGEAQFTNGEMSKQYDATRNSEDLAKRDNIVSDSIKRIEAMRGSADVVERNALDRTRVKKGFREKVMKAQSALREAGQNEAENPQERYSLAPVPAVEPKSDSWNRTHTTEEAMEIYPDLWNVSAEESETRNPTQIASTQGTYRNIYKILQDQGFDGKILDASSGLGIGTQIGRDEFGFDVEDIEPYPGENYSPMYTDYSKLNNKYDAIISSAVLNVLPQDQRDALVVKMGELLNDGGKMYITTRGKDVDSLAKTGKNIQLGPMEWIETVRGSYQKGFTQNELKAYLEDALGPDFTVELSNKSNGGKFNNNTSIVVTKNGESAPTERFSIAPTEIEENAQVTGDDLKDPSYTGGFTSEAEWRDAVKKDKGVYDLYTDEMVDRWGIEDWRMGEMDAAMVELLDRIDKIHETGRWSMRDLTGLSNWDVYTDFIELLDYKPERTQKRIEFMIRNLSKDSLENLKWFPVQVFGPDNRNQMRKAINLYNKIINAQLKAISANEDHVGRDLGVNSRKSYNLSDIRTMFEEMNDNEETGEIAKKVFNWAEKMEYAGFPIPFKFKVLKDAAGAQLGGKVRYDTKYFNNPDIPDTRKAQTLLHEVIHVYSAYAISVVHNTESIGEDNLWQYSNGNELRRNYNSLPTDVVDAVHTLDDIWAQIRYDPLFLDDKGRRMYGVTNTNEMVAELANPEFRAALKKKSLLQRILDAVKRLFGIETTNAYDAVSAGFDKLMMSSMDDTLQNSYQNYMDTQDTFQRFSVAPDKKNPFPEGSAEQQMLDMMNKADNPDALEDYINGLIEKRNQSIEHQKEIPPALPRDTLFPVNEKQKEIAQNQLDSLIKKYGLLQKGEKAARDKSYPERTSDTQFVRRTARTAAEAAGIPEYFADQIDQAVLNELLTYTRITDKMANNKSDKEYSDLGYKKAIKEWNENRASTNSRPDKYDIAFGERLLIEASRNNDAAVAMKVLADLAAMATQAGQVVQAVRMLKDVGPIGQLYYVQKAVDRINKENAGRIAKGSFPPITIDQKLAEAVVLSNTKKEMEDNMKVLIKSIADQLPVTLKDKWDAWRYLAMLGNPRTHVRNLAGNMIFVPVRFVKDMLAAAGEQFIDPSERTKSVGAKLHSAKYADVREYAKQDFKDMEPYITTGGKMNPLNEIMEARTIFKTPIIGQAAETLRKLNDFLLNKEDIVFLQAAYIDAFTQFVAARGLTAEQLTGPDGGATLNEARQYAALEAQKATYRDFSRLATALNGLRKVPVLGMFLDGLLPFTKTPINILKRGVEYSPVGLAHGVYDALFKVKRGDISAAQAIDEMASGLTGTGVAILGYILASMGLARGADDDDDKKQELEEAQGHQSYSLEIGDNSYTIDWAAPVALPFFVGVEAHKQMAGDGEGSFWDFCNAMTLLMEPMMSLSMLDGINSTLAAVKSDQNSPLWAVLSNVMASYVSQGAPTFGGQVARTFDPVRRSTYVDKNIEGPALLQRTLQGIQGKVPGLAKEKMAYIDVWGRKDTSSSALWRAFENFASPGYGNKIKETPVDAELMRLYDATGDNSVLPSTVAKYFQVEGERLDLTAKQYETYKTTTGQTAFKLIGELIDDPVYGSMNDAQKAETVKQLLEAATIIGKQAVAPNYKGTAWVERAVAQDNLETAAVFHTIKAQNTGLSSYQLIESMAWLTPEEQGKLIMSERSNTERKMTDYKKKKYKFILTDEQIAREREIYNGMFWPAYNELIYSPKFLSADVATRSKMISDMQTALNKASRMQLGDELRAEGYTSVLEDDSDVPEQPVDLYSLLNRG